jgi:phosphatidylinositol alpha-1,6-mannosyltransferase
MVNSSAGITCVFPAFSAGQIGGVQESARMASNAITKSFPAPEILEYDSAAEAGRLAFLARGLSKSRRVGQVLFWHVDLLKAKPFLRVGRANTTLFIHGIECWRDQSQYVRRLLDCVDLVLANSRYTLDRFVDKHSFMSGRPSAIVPLGLGSEITHTVPSPQVRAALILGRMEKREDYKGHREMINSWRMVTARIPDAELWIAGSGSLEADLRVLASQVSEKIRFFGHVTEEEKTALLTRCKCFAMPSRAEGFGLVYLEAMRLGRPCLVSESDAGREVVNPPEGGLAVDPMNAQALASALCVLLSDSNDWTRMSKQTQDRYRCHFTAARFENRLVAALCS